MNSQARPFQTDIETIRRHAREHMEQGPVTDGYGADRQKVIDILNETLATEIVCTLRYMSHYHKAQGIRAHVAAQEFREHARQEQEHVERVADRITQLGGVPNFSPEGMLTRGHADFVEGRDLAEMIREDLVAERVAIDTYREIVNYLGNGDPTSRRMMEDILAVEEEHAEDLVSLLGDAA